MQVNQAQLLRALGKVEEILHQYCLTHIGHDDPYRSVANLRKTVSTYLGYKVDVYELPLNSSESIVQGMFVMKPNGQYDICFVQGLSPEWKRFVICKELFHILIDQEAYRDMDIEGHVEALIFAFPRDDAKPRASVLAEFLAEVAAMEFLFPRARRIADLEAGTARCELSQRYGVPLLFVERYMSAPWMQNLDPQRIQGV